MNKIIVFTVILVISGVVFGQAWEIPQGSATIDADLSDWADTTWTWTPIDRNLYGIPTNISNAKMAVRWDTNNIYMAVTYDDADLVLSQRCLDWNAQDDIEVYINANNDDAVDPPTAGWATAQQYFVGAKGTNPIGLSSTPAVPAATWSDLGSSNPLPSVTYPYAVIDAATSINGSTVTYEMRIPAINDLATGSLQTLAVGNTVGVDVVVADKGTSNYGWKAINMDGGKSADAGQYQDWVLVNELTAVHYTFEETSPGSWDVLVEVTGDDTGGLSCYEVWVDGVDPATVDFVENTLATFVGGESVGFLPGSLLKGPVGPSFNVGNYQSGDAAIAGVGMVGINEPGDNPGVTPLVDLDSQALLGTLSTEAGLTEVNFRVVTVGLLNVAGDGFINAHDIIPSMEVISFVAALLAGDANRDGVVSAGDYASVQANFGSTGEAGIPGDANGDGVVSAGDYASVQANFGNTGPTQVTPEPATMSLLSLGALAFLRRRNGSR